MGTFFSPVLAAVLIVFALRHRPVLHRFLKFVIVLSLIVLIQTNFACATMASRGHLLQVLIQRYGLSSNQTPIEAMVDTYVHYVVTPPPFANDYNPLAVIPWALVQSYAPLTGPFFLLLFLVISHFLALPVYWLWVVLGVLYVVLPSRAWKWMGRSVRGGWKRPSTVWNPVKQGSLRASSDGSFAAATVNGVYPEYTTTVPRNSTVSVFVTGTPVSTTYTQATVTVIVNGDPVTTDFVTLTGGNFTRTYPVTVSADSYIRVEVFYGRGTGYPGQCFVNPVFIDTY